MKQECDLCGAAARVQCESDEARLCFECDGMVHSANFLVARHPRTLLCRCCGGATPWRASGPMLVPAASICDRCRSVGAKRIKTEEEEEEVDSGEWDFTDEDEEDDVDDDEEDEDEEEEEEEQVVPGTTDCSPPPPSVTESSSSSAGEEEEDAELATKRRRRRRENVTDLAGSPTQDRLPSSSTSRPGLLPRRTTIVNPFHAAGDDEAASDLFPPLKYRRRSGVLLSDGRQSSSDLMPFGSGFPPI